MSFTSSTLRVYSDIIPLAISLAIQPARPGPFTNGSQGLSQETKFDTIGAVSFGEPERAILRNTRAVSPAEHRFVIDVLFIYPITVLAVILFVVVLKSRAWMNRAERVCWSCLTSSQPQRGEARGRSYCGKCGELLP